MKLRRLWIVVLAFSLVSTAVMAQDDAENSTRLMNYRVGNLLVQPSVAQAVQYDGNILLEDTNAESDLISRSSLGLSLRYPTSLNVSLNHRTTVKEFLDNSEFNDVEQRTSGRVEYSSGSLALGVTGYRLLTSEPIDLIFTNRQELNRNSASPYFTLRTGALSTTLSYRKTRFEYEEPAFSSFNYREQSGRIQSTYTLSQTGFLRGGLEAGTIDYDDDTLGDSLDLPNPYFELKLGAGGNHTERLRSVVEVGAHVRTDLEELVSTSDTTDIEAFEALKTIPVAEATTIWDQSARAKVTVGYLRTVGQSSLSNHVERDRVKVQYNRRMSDRLTGRSSLSYSRAEESTDSVPQPEKDSYRLQLESTYEYRHWVPVSVLYTYHNKSTRDNTGEFKVHRLGVSVTGRF